MSDTRTLVADGLARARDDVAAEIADLLRAEDLAERLDELLAARRRRQEVAEMISSIAEVPGGIMAGSTAELAAAAADLLVLERDPALVAGGDYSGLFAADQVTLSLGGGQWRAALARWRSDLAAGHRAGMVHRGAELIRWGRSLICLAVPAFTGATAP